jgi:hypothetical protein
VPSMDTLELRVPVTESEQEFLYLVVKAAIHQYRLHRRGRISELANQAEILAPDRAALDTHPDPGATMGHP